MIKNEVLKTIESLRTIHWDFNERPISKTDVETIIESSLHTANSDNLTDYSVIVVDDPAVLNTISGGDSGGKSATCLIYAIDHTRIVHCAQALGYDKFHPLDELYNFFIAMYDVCAAAQTAVIAAKSMGIDSLITNFSHRNNPTEIMDLLNMPKEYCFPVIQVVLGYSDKSPTATTGRLSKKHVIHYGKYRPENTINTEAIIDEMDKIYPQYIDSKYKHALDWYFNEWFKEWYDEDTYQQLWECLRRTKLIQSL